MAEWSWDHPDLKIYIYIYNNNNNNNNKLFEYPLKKIWEHPQFFFMPIKLNSAPLFVLLSSKNKKPKKKKFNIAFKNLKVQKKFNKSWKRYM